MIDSNIYALNSERNLTPVIQNQDFKKIETVLRLVIAEFGAHRFAMTLLSDEYLKNTMRKAA